MQYDAVAGGNVPAHAGEALLALAPGAGAIAPCRVENWARIPACHLAQADHWRLMRMPIVDRNILRMALFELLHEPETPRPVVIDEALEIAKRFSTPRSSQFINGILDGVLKSGRAGPALA